MPALPVTTVPGSFPIWRPRQPGTGTVLGGIPPQLSPGVTLPSSPGPQPAWVPQSTPGANRLPLALPDQTALRGDGQPPEVKILNIAPGAAAEQQPQGPVLPAEPPAEQLGRPRQVPPAMPQPGGARPTKPAPKGEPLTEAERNAILGAARNAVALRDWNLAKERFDIYFRRADESDPEYTSARREYANVLVQLGKAQEAVPIYQQLIASNPKDVEAALGLADLYIQEKKYKEAIALLLPILQQDPNNVEAAVRLGLAYYLNDEFLYSLGVVEKYLLRTLKPEDKKVPLSLPSLLVDLDRPAEALAYLLPLMERNPDDSALIATLVRVYARLCDIIKAQEALQKLADRKAAAQDLRITLGELLLGNNEFALAEQVFQQALAINPNLGRAQIGMARVWMARFQPVPACALLKAVASNEEINRSLLLAWAEYHQLVGEYLEAKAIYQKILHCDPNDYAVRLALGLLYDEQLAAQEWAKAELCKIPRDTPQYRRAQVGIATALTNQRFFDEAIGVMKMLLAEWPGDGNGMARMIRTMGKKGEWGPAVELGDCFIQQNKPNLRAVLAVRLAMGRALLDGHRAEAKIQFEEALKLPRGKVPETYYGLAQSFKLAGDPMKADYILKEIAGFVGGDPRNQLLLADLFDADANDDMALKMAFQVVKFDPDNLAGLIRYAKSLSRLARQSGHIEEAVAAEQKVLHLSPTNVVGNIELARTLATGQKFPEAAEAYKRLISIDPTFRQPRRELARVYHGASQYDAAQAEYHKLVDPPAEAILQNELNALAKMDPRAKALVGVHLTDGNANVPFQPGDIKALGAIGADSDISQAVCRIHLDYQARLKDQTIDKVEAEEKAKDWLHFTDIKIAKDLLTLEPSNTSVLFDLGQQYSILQQTHNAIATYSQDLQVSPREREAAIAVERASLEMSPQLWINGNAFAGKGFNNLVNITRLRAGGDFRWPYGDENEYVGLGFSRVDYIPGGPYRNLEGNILTALYQGKCFDRLFFGGVGNIENYPDRLKTRPTGDIGVRYLLSDCCSIRSSLFLNNVVENGETLVQNIYRYGVRFGGDATFSRYWTADGNINFGHYSDHNDYMELFARTDYIFCMPPKQLKLVIDTLVLSYHYPTIFVNPDPNNLAGDIHPYFSPNYYQYYEARLEWKHWLSRDYFTHANQCWYSLQYALGFDNHVNTYNSFRGMLNYDVKPWCSVGGEASVKLSNVYNEGTFLFYVALRCPSLHH